MPEDPKRFPIRVVVPFDDDYRKPEFNFGPTKVFDEVTEETREALRHQVQQVSSFFEATLNARPDVPVPAKVTLKKKALAKSYRPNSLFSSTTCPRIGIGNFGHLIVSCTPEGLKSLEQRIVEGDSKAVVSNISTIESFAPWTVNDALGNHSAESLFEHLREREVPLRVQLFNHRNKRKNRIVGDYISAMLAQRKISYELGSSSSQKRGMVYVTPASPEELEYTGRLVGTQSVSPASRIRPVKPKSVAWEDATEEHLPPPKPGVEYPSVGIVDSGIVKGDFLLDPWLLAREEYLPDDMVDPSHGTFVASLAINALSLNADDRFYEGLCKVVDITAIPEEGITDDQLVSILEEVLPKYPDVRVWNLSIGSDSPCSDSLVSFLGSELDRLQDKFDVLFVVAAGNIDDPPFRSWPPTGTNPAHRISSPADSTRAISVGSIAHKDNNRSLSKSGCPSPFSRCGPGPAFLPKPELVLIGGNCDEVGKYAQTGVLSLDENSALVENIGTSFATPQMAALAAQLGHSLQADWNRRLVKALLVHASVLRRGDLRAAELPYLGFGSPPSLPHILSSNRNSATLLFEPELIQGVEWQIPDFPFPPSLIGEDGKARGVITLTVVYNPPYDLWSGSEYCQVNVDAAFGTIILDDKGVERFRGQVPPEPRDMKHLYEQHLIEHGFKWSPVKVYRRRMSKGIKNAGQWRLGVRASGRDGFSFDDPLPVTVLLTISSLDPNTNVYDEMVTELNRLGRLHQPLEVGPRVDIQIE